ncbi:hypothetical protein NH340_JMT08265 [Sarcoptes scabiei]|uniref:Cytochrome P450-like protein 26 n=1 Tax=Sarcoptes scabiei TaxID=52283 RepID=A0A132ALK3_SARSC|nr:cytochrome P450-like protein 26 [Sarcoptes scabiei]UXI22322.1 hypothetical protein NH340_JMT08265 [Sarcoptes scabiei]
MDSIFLRKKISLKSRLDLLFNFKSILFQQCKQNFSSHSKQSHCLIKSFEEIPGPRSLPFIGNLWRYYPLIGQYDLDHQDLNGHYNLKRYGKFVREEINKEFKILHIFDPKDMESMFNQQNISPYRRSHRALLKYRLDRTDRYRSGGIFPENGPEWSRLRDLFKHHFLTMENVNVYDTKLNEIADDFIKLLRSNRDSKTFELDDLQSYLYRWSLESIFMIMLDDRIGSIDLNECSFNDDARKMIEAAHKTIYSIMRTEIYNDWEHNSDTVDYRNLVEGQDLMAEVVTKYLRKQMNCIRETEPDTILSKMIKDPAIDEKDLFGIIMDFILAGIDTTSNTVAFVLYHLARNQKIQEELRVELLNTLNEDSGKSFLATNFSRTPLLKACIKESLRLKPISIGIGRLTTDEIIINGYKIPKNVMIITQNQVSCLQSEYFPNPKEFRPKRWMNDGSHRHQNDSLKHEFRYVFIPFGQGTRMCLGRRIAELEMYILIAKLLQNFRIEYNQISDVEQRTRLINEPVRPINIHIFDR